MPSPEKFRETLLVYGVPEEIIAEVNQGYEKIVSKSTKAAKAKYFKQALTVMEKRLGLDKTREIFEENGCCKTGARLKASNEFARINAGLPLEERLAKIRRAAYMNMGSPRLDEDGDIVVHAVSYQVGDKYACACPTISKQAVQPASKNYCYCCAGHFKFHYEIMLDCSLAVTEIVGSPLDSEGASPCIIKLKIVR